MVIIKDNHRFEIRVKASNDEWLALFREYVPGRLNPTLHVMRTFGSRESAIESLRRKWHLLFPEQSALVWREPTVVRSHWRTDRHHSANRKERPSGA